MAIRFTCECGADLAVPDGNDTNAVLCSSCGKTVSVPEAAPPADAPTPAAGDESPSALFRAAIAAFNDADLGDSAAPGQRRPMDTSDNLMSTAEASGETPLHSKRSLNEGAPDGGDMKQNAPPPATPPPTDAKEEMAIPDVSAEEIPLAEVADDDQIVFAATEQASGEGEPAPASPETAAQVVPPGGPATRNAMGTDIALAAIEARKLKKALNREGEPVSAASVYEPTDAEIHGTVIKFHCKCGKRISAPLGAKKSIGKCPKCGTRLALPKTESLPSSKERREQKRSADRRAANVKTATADAANRLRRSNTPLPTKAPPAPKANAATSAAIAAPRWTSRFVAFQVDFFIVAGIMLATAFGLRAISPGSLGWIVGGVVGTAVWAVNSIAVSTLLGGSCGMLLAGLKITREDGTAIGIGNATARAVMGIVLIVLAPLALGDPRGRTVADRIAGTVVVASGD